MPRPPVPRLARQLDVAGGALLLAGAACWGYSFLGLRRLPVRYPDLSRAAAGRVLPPPGAVAEADRLYAWSHAGIALFVAGAVVILAGALVAALRRGPPDQEAP